MTIYEIYDEVKKNGIPVGLDAWMPIKTDPIPVITKNKTWRDYIPEQEDPTISFQKARKERKRKEEEALQEALQNAAEYFG